MPDETPSPPPPPPSPPRPQQWRGQGVSADPARAPTSSRDKKAFFLAAVLLALGGAALAWLLYVRPMEAPYFLSLPVREYSSALYPVNALVVQDSDLLLQHFPENRRQKAYESQTRERLRLELQKLKSRGAGPVVVHLAALARGPAPQSIRSGEAREDDVFLLPGDADPAEPKTWLSLREVLAALRECPAPGKLLILDIMRPLADTRLGVLSDDIGTRVRDLLDKENLNDLLVLCACDKEQLSLVAENLNHSVFAYYLDQGIRGPADGLGPRGREDRRVTASELAAYVQDRIERWARHTHGVSQRPVLLGRGEDFPLVHVDEDQAETAPKWVDFSTPAWLRAGWETRDRWWDDGTFRLVPRLFRELETILLRTEQRWLGGIEESRLRNELKSDLDLLEAQRKKARDLPACKPASLAMQLRPFKHAEGKATDAAVDKALSELVVKAGELTAKAGDLEKVKAPFKEKFKAVPLVPLAWTAFELARRLPNPSPAQILVVDEMILAVHPDGRPVEVVYLHRLVELGKRTKDNEWKWPAPTVHQSLRTAQIAEVAVAALADEPAFLPLVAPVFQQAEDLRRHGDKGLFAGRPSGWEESARQSRQAELLYNEILLRLGNLQRARRDFDAATVLLPGFASFFSATPNLDASDETRWKAALAATAKLGDHLKSADRSAGSEELEQHLELRMNLTSLRNTFATRVNRLCERRDREDVRDYLEILALRQSPRMTSKERDALSKAGQKLARALHDAAERKDAILPPLLPQPQPPLSTRRATFAIDVIRLANLKSADELQHQLEKAKSPTEWLDFADRLREVWSTQLPQKLQAAENDPASADRISRILPLAQSADPSHWSYSPTTRLIHSQASAYLQWLSQRYRTEGAAFAPGTPFANFFAEAATDCQR